MKIFRKFHITGISLDIIRIDVLALRRLPKFLEKKGVRISGGIDGISGIYEKIFFVYYDFDLVFVRDGDSILCSD